MQARMEMRVAGLAMVAAAALVVVAMGHHPSGLHGGGIAGIVHGLMIGLLLVLTWGFLHFAKERGPSRPLILAGLLAYGASLFAHVGAATINGFIVPSLAGSGPPVSHDLLRFAWESNQALAKLGVYLTGAAYALWSVDLLLERTATARIGGTLGLLAGLAPALLLALGLVEMNVAGAFIIYAAHAAWAALIGAMLWRDGLARNRERAQAG